MMCHIYVRRLAREAAVLVLIAATIGGCTSTTSERTRATSSPQGPPTHANSGFARCAGRDLDAVIERRGSNSSAPFLLIALRDTTGTCKLTGYPQLAAYTLGGQRAVSVAIHHGTYEVRDPGPHPVIVSRRHPATFAVGTATAYARRPVLITRLVIGLPGANPDTISVHIPGGLGATAPKGKPYPIGITAFASE